MDTQNQGFYTHTEPTVGQNKPNFDTKDIIFMLLSFVAAFLIVDFGFSGGFKLGFTVAYAFLFTIFTVYLLKKGEIRPFPLLCGIMSICIVPVFALYCESITLVIAFFAIVFLWAIYVGGFGGVLWHGIGGFRILYDVLLICIKYPIAYIAAPFKAIGRKTASDGKQGILGKLGYVLIGLLLAIPAMAILLPLMISSDDAFAILIDRVFGEIGTIILHVLTALILTPFLISLLFSMRKGLPERPSVGISTRVVASPIICGFFGVLSFFYVFYLFSQLSYFVSAFSSILPKGYTYADYARRGFFELCAITLINLFFMFCAFTLVKKNESDSDIPRSVRSFGIFVSLFNLFLIGTAVAKMVLYISSYGLTKLRVLTTIFMLMMGILLICLTLRLIIRRFPYMAVTLIACTLLGAFTLYADVNTTVARYNTWAYLSGRLTSVDTSTLRGLGAAAVPSLERLYLESSDDVVRADAKYVLECLSREKVCSTDFRDYNYTIRRAYNILEKYPPKENAVYEVGQGTVGFVFDSFEYGYYISTVQNSASLRRIGDDEPYINEIDSYAYYRPNGSYFVLFKQGTNYRYLHMDEDYISPPMTISELTATLRKLFDNPDLILDTSIWRSLK